MDGDELQVPLAKLHAMAQAAGREDCQRRVHREKSFFCASAVNKAMALALTVEFE